MVRRSRGAHRSVIVGVIAALLVITAPAAVADTAPPGGRSALTPPVIVTDQASRQVLVLDSARSTWDTAEDPSGVLWSFSPDGDPRYADLNPGASWTNVSDAKVRSFRGETYVMANASGGMAAVVAYPSGEPYWAADTGRTNLHSIEMLPDGNVAVTASTAGFVRLYAASQGPRATTYAEYELKGGHGLQWDPQRRVLWALGDDYLVALRVGGTSAAPELTEVHRVSLPTYGGHDLDQVASRPDRLWVTTNSHVYQYSKSHDRFVRDFPGAGAIDRSGVKSVGDAPLTRQVLSIGPEPGHPCTWCSTTVQTDRPAGEYTLVDGAMYKARWWVPQLVE
jgi:hypothetical protein